MYTIYPIPLSTGRSLRAIRLPSAPQKCNTENWWRGKYFELSKPDEDESQIYNTNFEGNGFKYLLKVMADMLEDGRLESRGIFEDESLKMAEIVEAVRKH